MGKDSLAIGQLHWSTANYAPLQERALWDGLAALYDQVGALDDDLVSLFMSVW